MPSTLLCSLLFTLFFISISQTRGQVNVGGSLTAGDETEQPWISPSGDFAFGFRPLEKTDLYLLSIWYNKIPNTTIVWYANGDIPAPKGSKVELTEDRGLVLLGPQGTELWRSGITSGQASYGSMNNTGNFMVRNTGNETLWQSFEHPTDTLLPGQTLEKGGRILNSRLRETDFSLGRFQFRLIGDGNGVLNFNNLPTGFAYDAYYWTNTVDTNNASNAGLRVVFNESGYLYVLRANGIREVITPPGVVPSPENFYHRVILHFDGVLAQYSYPKNSTRSDANKWETVFKQPENICNSKSGAGTGPCGFNGICRLNEDQRATCQCPPRFSLLDPSDEFGGCKPDFYAHFCDDNEPVSPDLDPEFIQLTNIDWPTSDYELYSPYTLEDCQKSCLEDCFCNVIVFRDGSCWKKKLPLSNGRRDESLSATTLIKSRRGNDTERKVITFPIPSDKKTNDTLVLVVSLILGGSVFINFIFFGLMGFGSLVFYHKKSTTTTQSSASNLRKFTYRELLKATNGFKDEIGRGSYGIVYKGQTEFTIAVKKLDRVVSDSESEFNTEIEVIGQTHHRNLVKLIGYCNEGQNRILVYEFATNGALSRHLFASKTLNWQQRTRVAKGTARGLVYLHEECNTQIIHCDIKPQNVLLDQNFDAKIADFGLAKLLMLDQSRTFTAVRGTKGYVAPEWFRNLPVTPKVDVYSFGVLLLEIICCRRNMEPDFGEDEAILVEWVRDCYFEGKLDVLVQNDGEAMDDLEKVERFLKVAVWCIQEDPNLRPTMKMVLAMLEGISHVENPPLASSFSVAAEISDGYA